MWQSMKEKANHSPLTMQISISFLKVLHVHTPPWLPRMCVSSPLASLTQNVDPGPKSWAADESWNVWATGPAVHLVKHTHSYLGAAFLFFFSASPLRSTPQDFPGFAWSGLHCIVRFSAIKTRSSNPHHRKLNTSGSNWGTVYYMLMPLHTGYSGPKVCHYVP